MKTLPIIIIIIICNLFVSQYFPDIYIVLRIFTVVIFYKPLMNSKYQLKYIYIITTTAAAAAATVAAAATAAAAAAATAAAIIIQFFVVVFAATATDTKTT